MSRAGMDPQRAQNPTPDLSQDKAMIPPCAQELCANTLCHIFHLQLHERSTALFLLPALSASVPPPRISCRVSPLSCLSNGSGLRNLPGLLAGSFCSQCRWRKVSSTGYHKGTGDRRCSHGLGGERGSWEGSWSNLALLLLNMWLPREAFQVCPEKSLGADPDALGFSFYIFQNLCCFVCNSETSC